MKLKVLFFVLTLSGSIFYYHSSYAWDFSSFTSRNMNSGSFDPNNLAKSCNVEFEKFETLNSEQKEQCFIYFKGVVINYTALNQHIENSVIRTRNKDDGSVAMPVIPTITGADADTVNSMPPIPTIVDSMPPIPTIQGTYSMPPIPTVQTPQ